MAAGTRVGGFRVERPIGTGANGTVYRATQLSLRRPVALRLVEGERFTTPDQLARFDHRQRLAATLYHPNLVPNYEFGDWSGGRLIAMRLIDGVTLADLCERGLAPSADALRPLAGALAQAHAAGLAHGRVSERNILLDADGTPYLADLGLCADGTPEGDREALAAVMARLAPARIALWSDGRPRRQDGSARRPGPRAHGRLVAGLAGASGLAAVLGAVLALTGGGERPAGADPPPSPPGTTALGSTLTAATVRPLGCGPDPSPNTPACTLSQTALDGRDVTVRRAGLIRAWAVRGASGELALQVIRRQAGATFVAHSSRPERLPDAASRRFAADIPVLPGDRIAVRLGPGATIGTRTGSPRSAVVRWDGGLTVFPLRRAVDARARERELMLRADVEPGARPPEPRQLVGDRAAAARPGRPLARVSLPSRGGSRVRALVVVLPGGIAIDVVGRRRLSRVEVPDADSRGVLLGLDVDCGRGARAFCLRWRNAGGFTLLHEYRVLADGRLELIG